MIPPPSAKSLAALAAVCDTFISAVPADYDTDGYWARTASDQGVPQRIMHLISGTKVEDQAAFKQLMDLISHPMLGLTWMGPLKPAHKLTLDQRQRMLTAWSKSPIPLLRNAYNTLRKATTFLYFGDIPVGKKENPNWKTIGYTLANQEIKPDPNPFQPITLHKDCDLDCEVLVIGSGSGGGVVAATLAAAGKDVLVVEKGVYTPRHEFTQEEFPMLNRHFEAGALLATQDGSVTIMAGSLLGGGSAINWAGSIRTPDFVLEEWATQHGNPHCTSAEYQENFKAIEQRTNVGHEIPHNPQNQALLDAATSLGWKVGNIPMNLRFPEGLSQEMAWKATGYSCLGDAYGIKQGSSETFLRDAIQNGARLLVQTKLDRITTKNNTATGATGTATLADGTVVTVNIRAKQVVVCAGSLHTPVLLMKSGLTHPQIGRNLFLHPVVPITAFLPQPTLPWQGPMMSVIVEEFTRLHENWGFRLECPPIHPGLAASALSWENAQSFKADLLNLKHIAVNICLVRDRFAGKVTVGSKSGEPVIHYQLNPYDQKHLIAAMQKGAEAHWHAGAERITAMHNRPIHCFPKKGDSLAAFQEKIGSLPWGTNRMGLFSAHQMGTCRMGGNRDYPVQPNGETREITNLFVADASLFPSASGSNPMLSVQALALHVAKGIVD